MITIYHGSEKNVDQPIFGEGKKNNDFGLGFYCTLSEELAKEWAVSSLRDGFSNRYTLDTEHLNIFKFEQFGLYHTQLDCRFGGTSSVFYQNSSGKKSKAIFDRYIQCQCKFI